VTSGEIADRARAFKIPTTVIDGNDVVAVWQAAGEAVARARRGEGPSFIEARTYRIQGHLEAEELFLAGGKYREKQEIDEWRLKDPLDRARERLIAAGVRAQDLDALNDRTVRIVEDAVKFAQESEPADPELAFDLMFVGQKA
jgi:pyruvate dehydrogenase E1 component alpha subunit